MATATYGLGRAPMGSARLGFGSPATTDAPGTAPVGTGRKIDTVTRDYVADDTGNLERQSAAQQLVYIALMTVRDSTPIESFGLDALPPVVTSTIDAQFADGVRRALDHLVAANVVKLIRTEVRRSDQQPTRLLLRVVWQDVSSGEELVNTL